jgi:acyl-CoA reductase-like NAD-dependent aldehyde dehydrogenase
VTPAVIEPATEAVLAEIPRAGPDGHGYWFPPTVLAPVDLADRAARDEIFGPVACVIPLRDEAEAIALATYTEVNSVDYATGG